MTEAEAWAFLADKWENPTTHRNMPAIKLNNDDATTHTTCLCHNISALRNFNTISENTEYSMKSTIKAYLKSIDQLAYARPRTYEGAVERAKFCRKQAQQEEIKAWEIAALHWENATKNYVGLVTAKYDNQQFYGMCRFIEILLRKNIISEIILENMVSKIDNTLFEIGDGYYLAPPTFEGAQVRVQFCREQIQKIKQGR